MSRVLFWLLLFLAVWWLLRSRARASLRPPPSAPGGASPRDARDARPPVAALEQMVDCAHCGVHLPASETVRDAQGRLYCCADHRAVGPR